MKKWVFSLLLLVGKISALREFGAGEAFRVSRDVQGGYVYTIYMIYLYALIFTTTYLHIRD